MIVVTLGAWPSHDQEKFGIQLVKRLLEQRSPSVSSDDVAQLPNLKDAGHSGAGTMP